MTTLFFILTAALALAADPATTAQQKLDALNQGTAKRGSTQRFIDAPEDILVFERALGGQQLLCAFNLGLNERQWRPKADRNWLVIESVGGAEAWRFPPLSGLIARCLV